MADVDPITTHRELAAFHCYESQRETHSELPEWSSDEAGVYRTEYRFLITAARRRADQSCMLVAIEKIAVALATAEGEIWPMCNRAVHPDLPDDQREAIGAQRRQRYRHLARLAHSTVMNYYELGTDDDAYRQHIISEANAQLAADRATMARMRGRFASTVNQL